MNISIIRTNGNNSSLIRLSPGDAAVRGQDVHSTRRQIRLAMRGNNPKFVGVSSFWLTYQRSGRLFGVVILDSVSLSDAREHAAHDQIDLGTQFANSSKLEAGLAALVPVTAIGRMLTPAETYRLIEIFDRGLPKRPAAPSVKPLNGPGREQA